MKTLKKFISAVLAVVMICSFASVAAFAEEVAEEAVVENDYSFEYYFTDDSFRTICITAFEGTIPEDGYVTIPVSVDGFKVVAIAEHTFDNRQDLVGIIAMNYVEIDEDAFYGIDHEVDIIRENVDATEEFRPDEWYEEHKQDYVIKDKTLMKYKGSDRIVTIPYGCEKIAPEAFKGNYSITTIYIEKGLKEIGDRAFMDCKYLSEIVVGEGVSDIIVGKDTFAGTSWLENYPSEYVNLGTTLVKYKGELKDVVIPNVFKTVAPGAFFIGDIEQPKTFRLTIPTSVVNFGEDCFFLYNSVTDIYPEFVVYGESKAEEYLKANGLEYTYAALPGDIIFDGKITAADARKVLRISAKLEEPEKDEDIIPVADVSGDNKITAEDARIILRIAAKLDTYLIDQLLTMPRTNYEVLLTAANALSLARAYGAAYTKFEYQYLSDIKMNTNTKTYFDMYNKELTSQKKAQSVTYNKDTEEAYNNLFDITLIDATKIKSYSCSVVDNTYNITIVLNDETVNGDDVVADTFTSKVFPVETVDHFTSKAQGKYWYNDDIKYSMTYNDCTLKLSVEVDTLKVKSVDLQMNYDFSVTGKILGIAIKNGNGPATATRTDVVKYSNFVYFENE